MSLDFTTEEKSEIIDKSFSGIYGALYKEEILDDLMKIFRTFGGNDLANKFDKLEDALSELVDLKWADRLPEELGMRPVLCHGDLWSMNILWRAMEMT
ncbi:hypothetical protein KIN20_033709 [Parelaphostrongylus tenuis]|uniref:Uncharacterized protein n=1 Tax=Parelaphostrongylus tenuis TaxID=148309 RepID=A0AAD5R917_PARTN|nr:hypothetical protein KIN20_033709 [Parelaphostrongylus tenuis]